MIGVEREPLSITVPPGAAGTTVYLVSAHCEPLAIRDTREAARRLCEDAERPTVPGGALVWHTTDSTGLTELYVVDARRVEYTTEYTVAPIAVRANHPPLPAPGFDGDRFTTALAADVKAVLERHGYRLPSAPAARHQALARTLAALSFLVEAFEGSTADAGGGS
ncbi:hypothetical protein GCM10017673_46260 [Streptosporangium violaceochromogenes]|nr:hypothetical protein GCM10017673_46260 [Streptosporangium violaceochromogenes]